jgi:hypothetical protein
MSMCNLAHVSHPVRGVVGTGGDTWCGYRG